MALRRPTRWDVARELPYVHWKLTAFPAAFLLLGLLLHRFGATRVSLWFVVTALVQVALLVHWWAWDRLFRPLSSGQRVVRAKAHANRSDGAASVWDLGQHASRWAMRRRAAILRPSLAVLTAWQLWRLPDTRYAELVATTGWSLGPLSGEIGVYSSIEDVTLRLGGPRTGKTQSLANHILDAPGPVLCTSTRADLFEWTAKQRAAVGKVDVFNPIGLGGIPSTVRWTPLAGCEDYPTAMRRADSMVQAREGDARTWADQARRVLAVLLHAAALKGHRLQKVADWTADSGATARDEIIDALKGAPNALALVAEVRHFTGTNDRTRTSITTSIAPALQWLANGLCAEVGDAPVSDPGLFDVREFVASGKPSLYLIGSPDSTAVTPLISALTAEVAHQLRMVAGLQPAGRLDPPVALVLDEMALACPQIPVDQWTADMGGRGVTMHLSVQSIAQLRQVWGRDAAGTILNNTGTLVVFGGTKDDADLEALSKLTGVRLEQVDDDDRRYTVVLDGANISELSPGEVLVLARGIRPVIGSAPQVWQRKQPRRRRRFVPHRARVMAWVPRLVGTGQ